MSIDPRCSCPIGRKYLDRDDEYDAITAAIRAIRAKAPGAIGMNAISGKFGIRKLNLMMHRDECIDAGIRPPTERPAAPPGPLPASSPTRLVTASMEVRAIDMRIAGKSVEEIAEAIGVEPDEAANAIERVLRRTQGRADRKANLARELEVRRCDAVIHAFWDRATTPGDEPADQDKAGGVLLKAMERRSKLLGLDAPTGPTVAISLVNAPGFNPLVSTILAALRSHPAALLDVKAAIRAALGKGDEMPAHVLRA